MIEIDDAGSGSLIGGTGIGIFKKETQEYLFDLIPIHYFQHPFFAEKKYQDYVINIVEKAFEQLQISKKETIYLCRGYIFDHLRKWLSAQGYHWENTKIEGFLQNEVETSFNHYVIKLGLPTNFIIHARYAFGFHRLFKWVMADFKNRSSLCKTGWKSWQKWSKTTTKNYQSTARKNEYCLKCGNLIYKNHPVNIIEYQTNKLWTLSLHPQCLVS
jgi:hypothetical protein